MTGPVIRGRDTVAPLIQNKKTGDRRISPQNPGLHFSLLEPTCHLVGSSYLLLRCRHPIKRLEVEGLVLMVDVIVGGQPFGVVIMADLDAFGHADR